MTAPEIVNRVWNYVLALSDDGIGYIDYLEQPTFFIVLKMADESETSDQKDFVPVKYNCPKSVKLDRDALELQYRPPQRAGQENEHVRYYCRKGTKQNPRSSQARTVDRNDLERSQVDPASRCEKRSQPILYPVGSNPSEGQSVKDDSLEDAEYLPATDILAAEIIEQLEAEMDEFRPVEDLLAS